MYAITSADNGYVAGCNATIFCRSQLNMPGHPSTPFAVVPVGNNKAFDVYIYLRGEREHRIGTGLELAEVVVLVLRFDLDEFDEDSEG